MTTNELSELNLKDDFQEVLGLEEASIWKLEKPGPLEIWCTLSSLKAPGDLFQVRLLWISYPDDAPSLKFREPTSGRLDVPNAWPVVPGFRPSSLDACVNWCSEGFALHLEWRNDGRYSWRSDGNVLLKVLRILQEQLDDNYGGRFK
jgi:hypothetical protein